MTKTQTQARVVLEKDEYARYRELAKADKRSFSSWAVVAMREKAIADSRK